MAKGFINSKQLEGKDLSWPLKSTVVMRTKLEGGFRLVVLPVVILRGFATRFSHPGCISLARLLLNTHGHGSWATWDLALHACFNNKLLWFAFTTNKLRPLLHSDGKKGARDNCWERGNLELAALENTRANRDEDHEGQVHVGIV